MADQLQEKGVNLKVIGQNIGTSAAIRLLLFNMLGAMAKPLLRNIVRFETEIRAERQMDSIRNAKARSVLLGRQKHLTEDEQVESQLKRQDSTPIRTLMAEYNLSKASIYRYLDGISVIQPAN